MATGQQFALSIARFAKKANGNMDLVVRKVTLDLLGRVVRKTPVDTGRARGNWQVGRNQIPRGEVGTGGSATAAKTAAVGAGTQEALQAKAGDSIYIVNSVPYIQELEKGSSKQAPNGMVATTLIEYPGVVSKAAKDTRGGR